MGLHSLSCRKIPHSKSKIFSATLNIENQLKTDIPALLLQQLLTPSAFRESMVTPA